MKSIIELAKRAGVAIEVHKGKAGGPWTTEYVITEDIERFAYLIRNAALDEAANVVEQDAMAYAEPVWAQEIITDIQQLKT